MINTMSYYYTPATDYGYAYNGTNPVGRQASPPSQPQYYYEAKQLPSILLPNPSEYQPLYQKQSQKQQQQQAQGSNPAVGHPVTSPYSHPQHLQQQPQYLSQNVQLQQQQQQQPQQQQQQQSQQRIGYPIQYSSYGKDQLQTGYQIPLSPASLDLDARHSQSSAGTSKSNSIDYSSIVSSTLSAKRSKRKSKNLLMSNNDDTLQQQFPCPKCTKVFQKPYNLKSHMKTHSDEKPYVCKVCDRKFARSHDKKRHEALHGGEKNFKCEGLLKDGSTKWGCGKKFARSDALSRHFRTETGWLCIKPLMDEAKENDNRNSAVNATLQQHGLVPMGISGPQQSQQQAYMPLPIPHYEAPSLMDNSNFIRKLVNNKY